MITSPNFVVRDARADETDTIIRVTIAAYVQYGAYMPPDAWHEYREDIRANLSDAANGDHIVAERDGHIVGSVLMKTPPREPSQGDMPRATDAPEMRLLAVEPAARGSGIGRRLTKECIRRARAQGYASLTLHTHEIMAVALRMYERMGFVRAPELDYSPVPGEIVKGYRLEL